MELEGKWEISYLLRFHGLLLPGDPLCGRGRVPVGAPDAASDASAVAGPVVKVRHDGRGRVGMRGHVETLSPQPVV